jgi:hypothetical protein
VKDENGWKLILAFRDQSPSYAHGFTCSRIWQQMRERSAPLSETIPVELREDIIAMATAAGWVEEFIELSPEWLRVTFMRDH